MRIRPLRSALGFILVLSCPALVSGCFSAALSSEDAARASRLVIVPVESPPAVVMGYTRGEAAGLLLVGGAIGLAVQESVTRDARREVAGRLNELMRDWRMEQALAEECAGVLKTRSIRPLEEIRLMSPVPLPDAPAPTDKDPGPFIAHLGQWKRGADAALGWRSAPPLRAYQADPEAGGANWALEVGQVSLMRLSDGSMQIEIQARLLDIATGRFLAKGSAHDRSEPGPVEDGVPEARRLERQYRTTVGGLCTRMLADMKMITGETRP